MSTKATIWSPYQEQIFSFMKDQTSGSLSIHACAGSGKTTTLVEGAQGVPEPSSLALAFNKRIAEELSSRFPTKTACHTMNALGHRAWARALKRRLTLDKNKIYSIACDQSFEGDLSEPMALVRAARANGLVPKNAPGAFVSLLEDTPEEWQILADFYDIDWSPSIYSTARKILISSISQGLAGNIDFDDQIYLSSLFGGTFEKFPLVLVDEAQDLSLIQHRMLKKSLTASGRLIAVGDPRQAIYGFRGANANSMAILKESFSMTELPLTVSFRCPKAIVLEAKKIAPEIEAWDPAPEGEVRTLSTWTLEDLSPGSVVLCRNNAPLFDLAWKLIRGGTSAKMLGRDIGQGLKTLIKKLTKGEIMSLDQFTSLVEAWAEKEISRRPQREGIITDKLESLKALSHGLNDTGELLAFLTRLFDSATATVTLSSVHRAKGLEWKEVFLLDPWRIPSKYAQQGWQKEQEMNLLYVAITRAQRRLTYINGRDLKGE